MKSTAPLTTTDGNKKLSPQEIKFIDEYIANGGNATQACIEAGYSAKSPSRCVEILRFPGGIGERK